ncbi:hypothetical protein [Polyangium fumosum]|uniref:Uncharacterized protein n=1 Tax=Polyangium fumosum TaxID=889272 RepID=A0A4U1JKH4_9BACT|nr:hypothetical protein [Polyangium fumosum]TKD13077.1 hypothetical protein E8A74_00530 [Polyangium fumosum]
MRALIVGFLFVWFAVLGPACFEPTCKNPKRGPPKGDPGGKEGVLVQCNAVLDCGRGKHGLIRLTGTEDPQIIDTGSNFTNATRCEERAKKDSRNCPVYEVSPQIICLDAPGSNGCNAGTGDGSTVIIVGSAASGDYRNDPSGEGEAGGDGGGGAGGQGGI